MRKLAALCYVIQSAIYSAEQLSMTEAFVNPPLDSAQSFLAYYQPSRAKEFSREKNILADQEVAVHFFGSLAKHLNVFFELNPTAKEMRQLLELPVRFGRGQLHEPPSGPVVFRTMERAGTMAIHSTINPEMFVEIISYEVLPTAQFKALKNIQLNQGLPRFLAMNPNFPELLRLVQHNYYGIMNSASADHILFRYLQKLLRPNGPSNTPFAGPKPIPSSKTRSVAEPSAQEKARAALELLLVPSRDQWREWFGQRVSKQASRLARRFLIDTLKRAIQDGAQVSLNEKDFETLSANLIGSGFRAETGEHISLRQQCRLERCGECIAQLLGAIPGSKRLVTLIRRFPR